MCCRILQTQPMQVTSSLLGLLLALLLVSTTPVGTGAGVHQFDLLHPLFSHVHIINGRILTHEQMEQESNAASSASAAPARPTRGPAFGAGGGASAADGGLGLSPTVPGQEAFAAFLTMTTTWVWPDIALPSGREEAPPDPPPLTI